MNVFEKQMEEIPNEYRSLPFWSWNDKLDQEELRRQIRQMHQQGIGGFFMHARGGLKTKYLGEEWIQAIQCSIEEAEKLGMEAWLYDEEGWPSGFAGGRVTSLGSYYHMRWMEQEREILENIDWQQKILGIYDESGRYLGDMKENIEEKIEDDTQFLYVVYEKVNPYYVDVLNPKVIVKFLEVTHEKYLNRFSDEIGKVIPGFFTDEPQFAKLKIPYSICLEEMFEKNCGYSPKIAYTALFREVLGYQKYRCDFWKTISQMYTEGFCKTIYEWCKKNNCMLTGHLMREDSLLMQMQATAGVMPSYEYMDMPGIDWLRRRISSPLTPKQVGSAAAQLGKKFVISEMFAMTGWDCTPEELKWIAQWQYVNGVNRMCQHLQSYTIRGERKRDFPPSLFYQQSWWNEYKYFNDYFARIGKILSEGTSGTEVILLHPMHSAWMLYNGEESKEIIEYGQAFEEISQSMSDYHIDYHYGDEEIIRKYGKIKDNFFIVGDCTYKAVVIPDMMNIEKTTADLLFKFVKHGGKIYSVGKMPDYISGEQNPHILDQLNHSVIPVRLSDLKSRLKIDLEWTVSISENGVETQGVHYQLRKECAGNKAYLYIVNLNKNKITKNRVTVSGNWIVSIYDPFENKVNSHYSEQEKNSTFFHLTLQEMEGAILVLEKRMSNNGKSKKAEKIEESKDQITLSAEGIWKVQKCDFNSMTLDSCVYKIDSGEWQKRIPLIRLMDILLQEKKPVPVSLKFQFCMEMELEKCKSMYLIAEGLDILKASINGQITEIKSNGWWKDKAFHKFDILPFLQKDMNEIILEIYFYQDQKVYDVLFGKDVLETERNKLTFNTEIENIYLLGDFGVFNHNGFTYSWRKELISDDTFSIREMPNYVYSDDFTSQGFCFFAGKIKLAQKIYIHEFDDSKGVKIVSNKNKRYIYKLFRLHAMCANLYVNGSFLKKIFWKPYECDITDYIHPGENEIVLELYASNRNLFGPHHHIDGELYAVWPADFTPVPSPFKNDSRNVWSEKYHFVKFGL